MLLTLDEHRQELPGKRNEKSLRSFLLCAGFKAAKTFSSSLGSLERFMAHEPPRWAVFDGGTLAPVQILKPFLFKFFTNVSDIMFAYDIFVKQHKRINQSSLLLISS